MFSRPEPAADNINTWFPPIQGRKGNGIQKDGKLKGIGRGLNEYKYNGRDNSALKIIS